MNIEELKSKTISDLTNIAKDLKIQGHSSLRKQDLIFRILEAKTEKDGLMFELKKREHYVKPSEKRRMKKAAAIIRQKKTQAKKGMSKGNYRK